MNGRTTDDGAQRAMGLARRGKRQANNKCSAVQCRPEQGNALEQSRAEQWELQ